VKIIVSLCTPFREYKYCGIYWVNLYLAHWSYSKKPEAIGCDKWWCKRVENISELENAFNIINSLSGSAYLEVVIPRSDNKYLKQAIIDRLQKQNTPVN
jgi:TPP-dependent 2-oxoacid decarboxylase